MTEATSVPAGASGSLFDDILEIFVSPSKVFARRRDGGYGKLLLVLFVLTLIIVVATMGLVDPYLDAQIRLGLQQAAARGTVLPEAATSQGAIQAQKWAISGAQVILLPVLIWIGALFVMLGAKVAGAPVSYKQGALILTLSSFPRLLQPIAMAIQSFFVDPMSVRAMSDGTLSPARFMDPTTMSPMVTGLMANLDLIAIWSLVLVGIGIKVVGRGNSASAWVGAGVVLLCSLALTIIPAAIF